MTESSLVGTSVELQPKVGGLDTLVCKDYRFDGSDTVKHWSRGPLVMFLEFLHVRTTDLPPFTLDLFFCTLYSNVPGRLFSYEVSTVTLSAPPSSPSLRPPTCPSPEQREVPTEGAETGVGGDSFTTTPETSDDPSGRKLWSHTNNVFTLTYKVLNGTFLSQGGG